MIEQAQVWRQENVIFIQGPYSIRDACRVLPGAEWVAKYKVWRYPATPATAGAIHTSFGEKAAVYDPEFRSLLKKWQAISRRERATAFQWPGNIDRSPWLHQEAAYDRLQGLLGDSGGAAGLFAGMGTGKTLVATAIVASREWERVLIVCPGNMIQTWANELQERITGRTIVTVPLKGSSKDRARTMREHKRESGVTTVFITNYEGVWRPDVRAVLEADPPDAMILDEAQAIKSPGSKVSQFMYRLGKNVPYRLAMTGTPAHDKILDVYGLYRFLDPGIFGTNYNRFLDRYADRLNMGMYKIITNYKNEEELSEKMYRIAFRVTEDVLDLPEATDTPLYLELSPSGMKTYRTFERDAVLETDEGSTVAGNILTKLLRLQQIAAGFLPVVNDENETVQRQIDTTKADALKELLQEIPDGEPVVVFAKFKKDLEAIQGVCVDIDRPYYEESGRTHEWEEWQKTLSGGEVIGVQIDAGSSGIDLTRAAYVIYYTHGYSLGNYEQSRRRVLRPGQKRPVRYYHLLAKGTVDEAIMQALKSKASLADYVVEELRMKRGE